MEVKETVTRRICVECRSVSRNEIGSHFCEMNQHASILRWLNPYRSRRHCTSDRPSVSTPDPWSASYGTARVVVDATRVRRDRYGARKSAAWRRHRSARLLGPTEGGTDQAHSRQRQCGRPSPFETTGATRQALGAGEFQGSLDREGSLVASDGRSDEAEQRADTKLAVDGR